MMSCAAGTGAAFAIRPRPLRPGELDHERLWLAVSLAAGALGLAWLVLKLPLPLCAFREWTGFPCPTCGMTRMTRALLHGDLGRAFLLNPLAACAAAGIVLFDLYAAVVLALRLPRLRVERLSPRVARGLRVAAVALIVMNWAWLMRTGV